MNVPLWSLCVNLFLLQWARASIKSLCSESVTLRYTQHGDHLDTKQMKYKWHLLNLLLFFPTAPWQHPTFPALAHIGSLLIGALSCLGPSRAKKNRRFSLRFRSWSRSSSPTRRRNAPRPSSFSSSRCVVYFYWIPYWVPYWIISRIPGIKQLYGFNPLDSHFYWYHIIGWLYGISMYFYWIPKGVSKVSMMSLWYFYGIFLWISMEILSVWYDTTHLCNLMTPRRSWQRMVLQAFCSISTGAEQFFAGWFHTSLVQMPS